MRTIFTCFLFLLSVNVVFSQGPDSVLYKEVNGVSLYLHVDYPPGYVCRSDWPAVVFFFGGGWNGGSITQFQNQARYLADRGMVSFRADYRVKSRQDATPFECLMDAKSAVRFIRKHAAEFSIDQNSLVVSGGSAGGHLAAACATISDYNEDGDDLNISCIPDAQILFNPVFDNSQAGYGYDRVGEAYLTFSPLHNIRKGIPPAIVFLGDEDHLIPVETASYYQKAMQRVGSQCELRIYEGEGHGFFNSGRPSYESTLEETDRFLVDQGFLKAKAK